MTMNNNPQDPETRRLSDTQPQSTPRSDYYVPNAPEPPKRTRSRRPRSRRSNSGLYLPLWSVMLMLIVVIAAAAGVIALIVSAGGRRADGGEPIVVIVTPDPSATPQPEALTIDPTATIPPVQGATFAGPLPTFALEGPTLPPVILSPTPIQITLGMTVAVKSTIGLNIRSTPAGSEITRVNDGALFTVIDGPESAELGGSPYQWWKVRSLVDPALEGWAAADFLEVRP
jgi:hypothetical protein